MINWSVDVNLDKSIRVLVLPVTILESEKLKQIPKISYEEWLKKVETEKSAERVPNPKQWKTSNLLGEFGVKDPLLLGRLKSYDNERCKYRNDLYFKMLTESNKINSCLTTQNSNYKVWVSLYNSYYYHRNNTPRVSARYGKFLIRRDTRNWYLVTGNPTNRGASLLPIVTQACWNIAQAVPSPFRHFNYRFLKREKMYTKLKYSRSPQYDIVSGGVAALFSGFLGFLISEKFGIELVDSGDFYIALMYFIFLIFSFRPVIRLVNKFDNLTPIFSLMPLYITVVGLLTFTYRAARLLLKSETRRMILFFKIN